MDAGYCKQGIACSSCGAFYTDIYKLVTFDDLDLDSCEDAVKSN